MPASAILNYDGALELHAQFIGLHLPKSSWRLNQVLVHGVAVDTYAIKPIGDCALVKAEGQDSPYSDRMLVWRPRRFSSRLD